MRPSQSHSAASQLGPVQAVPLGPIQTATARGTEAVWLPPLGDPHEAHQQELLLLPDPETRIVAVDMCGAVPIIEVEVSDG
jgi:hypothetical protein